MSNEANIFYVQGGSKTPAPDIQINDDFELALGCALRYSLGRMTYVPSAITEYIKPLLPYLTETTIKVFKRDIYEQSKYEKGLGMDCDKQVWVEQPEDRGILLKDILESGEDLTTNEKAYCLTATYGGAVPQNTIEKNQRTMSAEPVCVGDLPNAKGGGQGAKIGLYAVPYELSTEYYKGGKNSSLIGMTTNGEGKYRNGSQPSQQYRVYSREGKSQVINTLGNENYILPTGNKNQMPVYEVKDGLITIKGKKYPIKLSDGYYIIRKLTPVECERLQTLPDNYTAGVSNSQRYKGLGNGWTAEVIIHIMNGALKDVPKDEEIVVLSMYDGIGTGRYCLDKMGFTNIKYYAYEIDKYAKQIANKNYPDIIQMGDAFDVRNPDWSLAE